MLKKWVARKKASLMCKWALELGLSVFKIQKVSGTEYLVDKNGTFRKLARLKQPIAKLSGLNGGLERMAQRRMICND